MIRSMTAFGRATAEGKEKDITVELRSVNSRYFDCNVRLPRVYSFMEDRIKNFVQKNGIARGKVDVTLTVKSHTAELGHVDADMGLAEEYIAALRRVKDAFSLSGEVSISDVAAYRDVFLYTQPEEDEEKVWEEVEGTLAKAVADHRAMREAEGKKTEEDIRAKLENVRVSAEKIEALSKADIATYRDRLEGRLRTVLEDGRITVDENRLLTECAIFADKIAIDEELARLDSHMSAFDGMCKSPEPAGRKLDFLMQEMNRETNTIGSKAANAAIAHLVVDIKAELEKIREQIQNVE